jgi:2-(1,2-epoxy-1,2-dihydrophenyl)acetyl-CoA isomerase
MTLALKDGIARITFSRGETGNAIDLQFGREFREAVETAFAESATRVLVLAAQGRNFCVGGDLRAMSEAGDGVSAYIKELTRELHTGILQLYQAPVPVIAEVNGTAAGAGLGLVLSADLAIAARHARFVPAYGAVGLTPDGGCTFALPRAVGRGRALSMFLNNTPVDADTALAWGLVSEVVEDSQLASAVSLAATRLALGPKAAFAGTKRLITQSFEGLAAQLDLESRSIAERADSREGREGIAAFLSKRSADFRAVEAAN